MSKYLPYIFAFFPILNIYETGIIPALSIGQILLFIFFFIYIRHNRIYLQFHLFIGYSIIITIFCLLKPGISANESIHELIALFIFFILYSFVIKDVDYIMFSIGLKILGFISLFFFFFQYLLSLIGIHVIGIIPGIPLSNGTDPNMFHSSHLLMDRLSSIFQEPAHYAEFMSMFLTTVLFKYKHFRKKIILAILISMSIILCQSAGGYILFSVSWICWLKFYLKKKKHKFKYIIPILFTGIIMIVLLIKTEMVGTVLNRYQTLSITPENSEYGFSSYLRLIRGYIPFIEGSIFDKIFGHGVGTLLSFVRMNPNSMFLAITDYDANWINSFQFILFSTGLIGVILFFTKLFRLYKRTSYMGKTLMIIYILALCSSGMLLTASSMLFLYIIYEEQTYQIEN